MAITQFGAVVSNPTDPGTNTSTPLTITPPASMTAGDLVFVFADAKTGDGELTVSTTGGQTWENTTAVNTTIPTTTTGSTLMRTRIHWCRFNGTWDVNPQFNYSGTLSGPEPYSVVMIVFRPTTGTNTWAIDTGPNTASFSTDATITISGITPAAASTVSIAAWAIDDNNAHNATTSTGWTDLGDFLNSGGTDIGVSFAYQVLTSSTATGDVTKTTGTAAVDDGVTYIIAFKEESTTTTLAWLPSVQVSGSLGRRAVASGFTPPDRQE